MSVGIKRNPLFVVDNFETLKAISDPLRIRLMDEINLANDRGELRTVKQLAKVLETTPQKLYYHIHMLEEHGLIRVAGTQVVSGIIEKHYAMQAMRIQVTENLFNTGERSAEKSASAVALFDSAAQSTRSDFITLMESSKGEREHLASFDGRWAHFTQERVRLTPSQARAFQARLMALTEAFSAAKDRELEGEGAVYNLLTVFIPSLDVDSGKPGTGKTRGEKI